MQHDIWRRVERVGWWKELGNEIDDIIVCHADRLVVNVYVYRRLVLG